MTITVRKMAFAIPKDTDAVFIAGEPEESYVNVALSLLLPYLEPYLIRTMRAAKARVTDPALAKDLEAFVAQEGHHYRQHAEMNAALRIPDAALPKVRALEAELDADYRRFTKTRSLAFNLAYAEGFEAMTAAMAIVFTGEDHSKWNPELLDLFTWHLVEELEHRTVAFDVYEHVHGRYATRLFVGVYAQYHLLRFLIRASEAMAVGDPRMQTEFGGAKGWRARRPRLLRLLTRKVLPRVARSWRPGYDPRELVMPAELEALQRRFTEAAASTG